MTSAVVPPRLLNLNRPCGRREALRGVRPGPALELGDLVLELGELLLRHRVRVAILGEGARADVADVLPQRVADLVGELRVALHEARRLPRVQAEQVVPDENLAVAAGARADPDRRNRQRLRDAGGDR